MIQSWMTVILAVIFVVCLVFLWRYTQHVRRLSEAWYTALNYAGIDGMDALRQGFRTFEGPGLQGIDRERTFLIRRAEILRGKCNSDGIDTALFEPLLNFLDLNPLSMPERVYYEMSPNIQSDAGRLLAAVGDDHFGTHRLAVADWSVDFAQWCIVVYEVAFRAREHYLHMALTKAGKGASK